MAARWRSADSDAAYSLRSGVSPRVSCSRYSSAACATIDAIDVAPAKFRFTGATPSVPRPVATHAGGARLVRSAFARSAGSMFKRSPASSYDKSFECPQFQDGTIRLRQPIERGMQPPGRVAGSGLLAGRQSGRVNQIGSTRPCCEELSASVSRRSRPISRRAAVA